MKQATPPMASTIPPQAIRQQAMATRVREHILERHTPTHHLIITALRQHNIPPILRLELYLGQVLHPPHQANVQKAITGCQIVADGVWPTAESTQVAGLDITVGTLILEHNAHPGLTGIATLEHAKLLTQ